MINSDDITTLKSTISMLEDTIDVQNVELDQKSLTIDDLMRNLTSVCHDRDMATSALFDHNSSIVGVFVLGLLVGGAGVALINMLF